MANFILTGIGRSGSSLMAGIISEQKNTYCMNETLYEFHQLNKNLNLVREMLINGEAIPDHYDKKVEFKKIDKKFDESANVGVKVMLGYLNYIQYLRNLMPTIALLRHPLYTIASWNRKDMQTALMDDNLSPRYFHIPMTAPTLLGRQAELWNYYATILYKLKDVMSIIRYEDLVENPKKAVKKLLTPLDIKTITISTEIKDLNQDSRYDASVGLDLLREAIEKYSPIAKEWGYEM